MSAPQTVKPQLEFDHVVLAAADLEAACDDFEASTGCRPVPGGPHVGLGTRNALVSFGSGQYLEILAPDPVQPAGQNLAARLEKLAEPVLFHWALRCDDLEALGASLRASGLQPTPSIETSREQPDGRTLVWDLMGLPGRGGAWPFFIDWRGCPHPSENAPVVGAVRGFSVSVPADPAALPLGAAGGVTLREGSPGLTLAFESGQGSIDWHCDSPSGFFG